MCVVHIERTSNALRLSDRTLIGGIDRWQPLSQQRYRIPRLQCCAVAFQLRFDKRENLILAGGSHQGQEIIITAILSNIGKVLFQRLRLIGRKPLNNGTEDSALTNAATDISREKQHFHSKIGIFHICAKESICDLLVTLPTERTDGCEQIQTFRLSGQICNRSIFRMGQIRFILQILQHNDPS